MSTYEIHWQSNDGNLWGADQDGVDVAASENRYYDQVMDAIQGAYPDVPIRLQRQGAIGYDRGFEVIGIVPEEDGDEEAIVEHCSYLAQQVFELGLWYVETDS